MAEFFQLSPAERLDALNAAADISGRLPHLLEKDVCASRFSNSCLVAASKGAARDSVGLISVLQLGQVIVGSVIASLSNQNRSK